MHTDNIKPFQKRLEVGDDFEVTRNQTTREAEATRVDVGSDNGRELEMGGRMDCVEVGSGVLGVNVLTGVDLHGLERLVHSAAIRRQNKISGGHPPKPTMQSKSLGSKIGGSTGRIRGRGRIR